MNSLLQEVTRSGTAARAQATLKRTDLAGKTGTTNDSVDAWFAGYQPTVAAVTWIGYDTPRNLGSRETGGGLSLPVWISSWTEHSKACQSLEPKVPAGVVNVGVIGSMKNTHAAAYQTLGLEDKGSSTTPLAAPPQQPAAEERNRILDLFKTRSGINMPSSSIDIRWRTIWIGATLPCCLIPRMSKGSRPEVRQLDSSKRKFTLAFGVLPIRPVISIVVSARSSSHPDLVKRFCRLITIWVRLGKVSDHSSTAGYQYRHQRPH